MNPVKQIIAIAEAQGIRCKVNPFSGNVLRLVTSPGETVVRFGSPVPDYINDLNAIHQAFLTLGDLDRSKFCAELANAITRRGVTETHSFHHEYVNATAAQRAEAFLRTIGKWE